MRKIITLVSAVTFSLLLYAQEAIQFNFTFNHMALSVKEVNASAGFYKKVFQFTDMPNRSAIEGIRWLSMGEDKELHLISIVKEPVTINKAVHLAFNTQQLDAFIKHLDELKIEFYDFAMKAHTVNIRADGVKQIYFKDPDSYWIEVNNGYATAPPVDSVKNAVWQMEERYWQYVKANDIKSYLTLWDDNFIGYPSGGKITGKNHISDWVTEQFKDKSRKYSYELNRKTENVFGDIVIAFYDVTETWTNDKNVLLDKNTFKITHTWKKTDNGWLIIGGMSAKK